MQIKRLFFEIIFLDFQLNASTKKINSESIMQKVSTSGGQSLKLQASVQKRFFFQH